jgi:Lipopolysaccharide export system permease LptF/LptG
VSRPGARLRALAARVCSAKTMERLIDPVIGDLQVEYASAIGMRRRWLARLTGYIAFAKVGLWCGLLGLREARRNWNAEDAQGLLHTIYLSGCAIVIVSVPLWLMELPLTLDLLETAPARNMHPNASVQRLMFYLVPAVLPLSVPVGLAIGAALGARGRVVSNRLTAAVMLVAFTMSAVSLVTVGWVTPNSNQAYREAIAGARWLNKGDRELTLIELRRSLATTDADRTRRLLIEFHRRLAFAAAPITFGAFALVVAIRRRARPTTAVAVIVFAAVGYYVTLVLGESFSSGEVLSPALGAWISQIALIVTTIVVGIPRTSNRRRA